MTISFGWQGYSPHQWQYWFDKVAAEHPDWTPAAKFDEARRLLREYKLTLTQDTWN